MRKPYAVATILLAAAIAGSGSALVLRSTAWREIDRIDTVPTDKVRALYPHEDDDIAEEINVALNVAMDIREGVSPDRRLDQIAYLQMIAIDDLFEDSVRRWTIAAVADVMMTAELSEVEYGHLARILLRVIYEEYGNSPPTLKMTARRSIIDNGLIQYTEFLEAVRAVENDPEVIVYMHDSGLEFAQTH